METYMKPSSLGEFARAPAKEKFMYFFGEVGSQSLFYYLILTLSSYFYTDVIHLSASVLGIIVIVSRCFDAFTDLLIGTLIDRTRTRFGKARPWCLIMTLPYAFAMFLMYCVPVSWTGVKQVVFVVITYNLAVTVCYTFQNIPWGTLSTLITRNKVDRAQLSGLRMSGSFLAGAIGVSIALPLVNRFGGTAAAWREAMLIFAIVGSIINFIAVGNIKERVKSHTAPEHNRLDLPSTLSNKYFWMCLIIIGLYNAFNTCFATMIPYYSTYVLKNTMLTTVVNNVQTITIAAVCLLSFLLSRKVSVTTLIKIGIIITVPGQIVAMAAPESLGVQVAAAFIRSVGWGLLASTIFALVGDAVEYGEWRTGHRAEGTTYASQGMGNKLGVLLGGGLMSLIMGVSGYDGSKTVQTAGALATIKVLYLVLPLVFSVVVLLVIMLLYKLDKKRYNYIVKELSEGRYHPKAKYAPEGSGRSEFYTERDIARKTNVTDEEVALIIEKMAAADVENVDEVGK